MTWKCAGCGATVEENAIDREMALAHCRYCGGVFDLGGLDLRRDTESETIPFVERARVPLPSRFSVAEGDDRFAISWREDACGCGCLLLVCLLGVGAAGAVLGWFGEIPVFGGWERPAMLLLVVAGVATLIVLMGFFQRTTVRVEQGVLSVRHGPLPMGDRVKLSVDDILQIFCVADSTFSDDEQEDIELETIRLHDVVVKRKDGRRTRLIENLDDLDQALFVEQQLERYLGIRDRAVSGEVPRGKGSGSDGRPGD